MLLILRNRMNIQHNDHIANDLKGFVFSLISKLIVYSRTHLMQTKLEHLFDLKNFLIKHFNVKQMVKPNSSGILQYLAELFQEQNNLLGRRHS